MTENVNLDRRYLERLAELFPTIPKASTEIINLQSIMHLPKGTEHFITDIHGEYEAFSHVLRNGSGSVKKKIDEVFGRTLSEKEKNTLATLIYYPKEKLRLLRKTEKNMNDWYKITLYRLIEVCKQTSSKYTRSKVRKALPQDFAYVIEELITEKPEVLNKEEYYNSIVDTIIDTGRAEPFIVAISNLIQQLVIDHLHILGDIFDRGPHPELIMERLMNYHSLDMLWGNHDAVWMGAAAGSLPCIATVIRFSARYGNLDILEDGYGINMLPLATFSMKVYGDDPCTEFGIHGDTVLNPAEEELNIKMHKAISIIQFKLEGQLIKKRRGFEMEDRLLLDKIDFKKGTVRIKDKDYPLLDTNFPTVDPADPYKLTKQEQEICERLQTAFMQCTKLRQHVLFMLKKGSMYLTYNNNLMYHGCVPMDASGHFLKVNVFGKKYAGKALYDEMEKYVRKAFFSTDEKEREKGRDLLWYIWGGPKSPVFGKDKMATFERYFVKEKETHEEIKNPYYKMRDDETVMNRILKEFGLDEQAHIVNGHVPVKQRSGENPVKCGGKVLVIDGGFSKAYQSTTGIAGYTLIYNSYGMRLVAHKPFTSAEEAVKNETDIHSEQISVMMAPHRMLIADTDKGRRMKERIDELKELLAAYRSGVIAEKA
ncbi:MAG: fructose-1,6-bisphosphatase [Eubacterium sp.]|nr:fructose-1,6-bisphosphatase [Eubacterium sp.]